MKGNTQNNVKLVGTRPSLTEPKAGGKPRAGLPMTSVGVHQNQDHWLHLEYLKVISSDDPFHKLIGN